MKLLTSGDLAKLFQISKYKIRHYIDEGLLTPDRNEDNDYYYFNEQDVYRLYQILMFRKVGLSISEIKDNFLDDSNTNLFKQAHETTQRKIEELMEVQLILNKIIDAQSTNKLDEIVMIEHDDRYFKKLPDEAIEYDSIDYIKATELGFNDLEEPYFLISESDPIVVCLESDKDSSNYYLPQGEYASKSFVASSEQQIEKQIELFMSDKAIKQRDRSLDNLLLYENIYCSLAYRDAMVYTIEVKL